MKDQIGQKLHLSHLSCLCRRTVALTLALAMVLPTAAFGAGPEIEPGIRVPHALEPGEEPTITVEANAVVNRWYDKAMGDPSDYLTGDLEVAIRVQSGQIGGVWQPFNTLSVALDYSPILTPYKWTLIDGIDLSGEDLSHLTPEERVNYKTKAPNVTEVDLVNNATYQFDEMTSMQTLKSKQITTAVAHVSGQMEKDAEGNVTAVKDGHLYMMAQADRPVVLEKDTVLAVVTFKYDVENIKILASQAPDWFKWLVDAGTSTAAEGNEGDGATGDGTGDGTTGDTTGGVAPEDKWLVKVTDITPTNESYFAREIHYDSQDNSMYYSVDRKGLYAGLDTTVTPPVEVYVDNYIELNHKVNDVAAHQVNFTLVNQTTYNDGGLTLDDLATVLFYDWDDTLLGLVIVPKDGDARKIVNDYISSHFIHPQLATNTNYTSLARVDNYRGKYPTTAMSEEDAKTDKTAVTNGGEYALTNKLDYVFFKRPMEQVMKEVDGKMVPTGEWKQVIKEGTTDEEGYWNTEYPYLYGWAVVPDYRHPEKVWTTLGMGELSSYSGSANGGYQEIGKAPATVIPTDTTFKFADFDFRVKNDNSLTAGSIYAVKAVYEPGDQLLNTALYYRMISQPYYNKLNAASANGGGAYSVDLTFERATTEEGNKVRGVARMREPYIRQDTTTDLLWETVDEENEKEDLRVNHNLPSATHDEAYTDKNKSTYTKVDVSNSEEISFSLTLSGRQNKVDYYFIDGYDSNFVAGTPRSSNDSTRSEINATLDNYNYYVENQSDEFDVWNDVAYEEREGSQGFVLNGSLNQIMKLATQCNEGLITELYFSQYVTADVLRDVNIRFADGKAPTFLNVSTILPTIRAAAAAAKPSANSGSTKYWDTVHNYAQLTYHQLQGFIIDNSLDHDESPITDSNGKVLLNWCHLHKDCVDAVSTKPKDWASLIDKAKNSPDDIDGLTLAEVENLFHLRKDAAGAQYNTVAEFKADIVRAVTGATSTTWDQIQANILKETLPTDVKDRNYWWYNGATSVPLNSLADTVAAAQDAITAVKMPDGTTMKRYDKLNQLKPVYDENYASTTVARNWNNATKNLCITKAGSDGEKFDTFADFRTVFIAAVTEAEKNMITLETTATPAEVYAYWQKLQYHILNKSYSATHLPIMDTYWWYDGMSKIGDLASLFAAAQRQVELDKAGAGAEDAVFKMFDVSDLYDTKLKELHFRSNFHGDKYTDITAFKDAVKEFVQLRDKGISITIATSGSTDGQKANSWNQLQYYLIHKDDAGFDPATIVGGSNKEREYYWWRNGVEGEVITLAANTTDTGIQTLMEAIYRHVVNGNPWAYNQLDAAAAAAFRLVSDYNKDDGTVTNVDTLLSKWGYTDATINNLYTALDNLYGVIPAGTDYSTITWRQIQHYLLKTEYKPADGTDYPSDKKEDENGYWWKDGKEKPTGSVEIKSDLEYLFEEIDKYAADDPTADLDAAVDQYIFSGKLRFHGGTKKSHKFIEGVTNVTQIANVRKVVVALATTIKGLGVSSADVLDWYILQYYMINDKNKDYKGGMPIVDSATAKAYYLTDLKGNWVPAEYEASGANMATMMAMFAMVPDSGANTTIDVDPDTGITTVTTIVETELENGFYLTVETVTMIDPETNATTTKTITVLMDEEGNVISSTETVTGQPEPELPAESPVPTESETPAPSESVGADVPIGPETSPEPTESPEPDVSPSPDPSETPADPEPAPTPTPAPSEPPEELPDPETPKEDQPSQEPSDPEKEDTTKDDPTSSSGGDTSDPASPSGGGVTGKAGDGEGQETDSLKSEVSLTATPPPNLSTTALTRSRLAQSENGNYISNRLPSPGGGRLRRPTQPKLIGLPQGLLTHWTPDRINILTIGRTQA